MGIRPEILRERQQTLSNLLRDAISGSPLPLFHFLARYSALPGPRGNEALLLEFAELAASTGPSVDRLLIAMATIDADYAMGATEFEFVPMCGVLGLGHRAARDDKAYSKALIQLQTSAEDLRFRVRDTVPKALAKIGSVRGNTLISDVSSWTDGFFQGAAMLRALADPIWLTQISDATSVVNRLDETFRCLKDAPRSASRYPGYKALVEAISTTPGVVALRFGIPIFDTLVVWSNTKEPLLREAIEANLVDSRLGGRHSVELERVRASLIASAPQRRDPTTFVGPTRNRSKAQRRRA